MRLDLALAVALVPAAASASGVALSPGGALVAAVNPESDSVTLVDAATLRPLAEIAVGDDPRALCFTPDGRALAVANRGSADVSWVDVGSRRETRRVPLRSAPLGVAADGRFVYASESAAGSLAVIASSAGVVTTRLAVEPGPAGLALARDGRTLLVTHFRTGRLSLVGLPGMTVRAVAAARANTGLSQSVALSIDGRTAYLPQTASNPSARPLGFDRILFPVVNVVDLGRAALSDRGRLFLASARRGANRPAAAAASPDGRRLYVANAGSGDVSVLDLATGRLLGQVDVGAEPSGVAVSPDGARVYVVNALDGTLSVIRSSKGPRPEPSWRVVATVPLTRLALDPAVLRGKRLFHSAVPPELSTGRWVSCASCHPDGGADGFTWLGLKQGPRNTPALYGAHETLPLHWSGDLDELQDVEGTVRNVQFGRGLAPGLPSDPAHRRAGASADLDGIAAYIASLRAPPSPHAATSETARGAAVFDSAGCRACHPPPLYTDRRTHGYDTPSLRAVWLTAPYFHDGSAPTLEDVLRARGPHDMSSRLTAEQLVELAAYLRSL